MRHTIIAAALVLAACGATTTPATTASVATTTTPSASSTTSAQTTPVWDPASARSWDRNLIGLMPQIDACLAKSPGARQISYAGENGGVTLVRIQGENPVDCRVSNGLASISPRNDTLNISGDGDALFVRGPGENPGGECYTAPEVRDASGRVLGWMLDPEGC